jgi:hypothetical protein
MAVTTVVSTTGATNDRILVIATRATRRDTDSHDESLRLAGIAVQNHNVT